MNEKRERHRFRFSLRTLFVVVTVLALWLGWQLRIVRERRDVFNLVRDRSIESKRLVTRIYDPTPQPLPPVRRWLGDTSFSEIHIDAKAFSADEVQRIKTTFPEIEVTVRHFIFPAADE